MRSRVLVFLMLLAACGGRPSPGSTTTATDEATPEADAGTDPPVVSIESRVRLIHAAIESRDEAVTLVADGTATSAATGYQFSSAYLSLAPGEHALSARANDTELIGASFRFAEGMSTIIAYSTADFPVALAPAADPSRAPARNSAQVRFFHAIVGQGALDVCSAPESGRGDGSVIAANVTAGALGAPDTGYLSVPGGAELVLQLRAQNATPCHGRVLGMARFTPASESNYTLIFVGRSGRHRIAPELLFCADPPAIDTSCATVAVEPH